MIILLIYHNPTTSCLVTYFVDAVITQSYAKKLRLIVVVDKAGYKSSFTIYLHSKVFSSDVKTWKPHIFKVHYSKITLPIFILKGTFDQNFFLILGLSFDEILSLKRLS